MKKTLIASVATLALSAGLAHGQSEDGMFTKGEGPYDWEGLDAFAAEHDYSGAEVTILGPWLAGEQENFENLLAFFEEATGASVSYVGSDSMEQQIVIDAEAGSAPNIAVFPQPGLAANMAQRGFLAPLDDDTGEFIASNYAAGDSWVDLGTYENENGEDNLYGFFFNANVKSLVWYIPENFEDFGYEVPETMEDLKALTEQMVEDGETPWCIGLGSGGATGWPATDWVEDLMLRTQEPAVYDQWVNNEIPFNDPAVVGGDRGIRLVPRRRARVRRCRGRRFGRLPRLAQGSVRCAAAVHDAPSGLVHSGVFPGRHRDRHRCRFLLLPGLCGEGPGPSGSGCGHASGHHG